MYSDHLNDFWRGCGEKCWRRYMPPLFILEVRQVRKGVYSFAFGTFEHDDQGAALGVIHEGTTLGSLPKDAEMRCELALMRHVAPFANVAKRLIASSEKKSRWTSDLEGLVDGKEVDSQWYSYAQSEPSERN